MRFILSELTLSISYFNDVCTPLGICAYHVTCDQSMGLCCYAYGYLQNKFWALFIYFYFLKIFENFQNFKTENRPTKRAPAGGMVHIYYGIGYVPTSLIGFLCPDWRDFTMVIVLILTFYFLLLPLFPESPAWQLSSKKFRKEARLYLQLRCYSQNLLKESDVKIWKTLL